MFSVFNVYKLNLPFLEYKYEEAFFYELCWDFEKLMKYEWVFQKVESSEWKQTVQKTLYFIWGKCEFIFHVSTIYYIPKYQIEVFWDSDFDSSIIKKMLDIFISYNLRNYIFDYSDTYKRYFRNKNILTSEILEKDFTSLWVKKLEDFLRTNQAKYLSETLKNDIIIRNSFYFMIYVCYCHYQNKDFTEKQLWDIMRLQKTTTAVEYQGILELSGKRLRHIHTVNMKSFEKYKQVLEIFFELLKNT